MVVKSLDEAFENFKNAVIYIPERYEAGVRKADWYTPASSDQAEKNFADAMSKVIAEKRRQEAIKALSNDVWQKACIEKGKPIIGERIRLALSKWREKWGPIYAEVVRKVEELPPKTRDWKQNIQNRLVPIVETWIKASGKG